MKSVKEAANKRIIELESGLKEQCEINAISAEKELKLQAEISRLKISLEIEESRAKARGESLLSLTERTTELEANVTRLRLENSRLNARFHNDLMREPIDEKESAK